MRKIFITIFCLAIFSSFANAEVANVDNKAFDIASGYYISGCQKLEKMDFNGALADFDKSIKNFPSPQAYLNRGFIKDEFGDFEGAIRDYTLCIESADENDEMQAEAYYNRALANESVQRYNASLSDYASAIELNPKNADYYAQRAILKSKLKGYQSGALADIDKAISLEPTHAGFKQIRAEIAKITGMQTSKIVQEPIKTQSVPQKSQTTFQSSPIVSSTSQVVQKPAPQVKKEAPKSNAEIAREHMQNKNFGLAIEYFGRAIDEHPFASQNAELYYYRGACYKNLGNLTAARKDYDQAVLLDNSIRKLNRY